MFIAYDKEKYPTFIEHAVPGWDYYCPVCSAKMSIRRGELRQHYFAHYPGATCSDSWDRHYDFSEWHRDWQALFPVDNQEVVVQLGDVKHRADVLIGKTVIEFQHSPISAETFNNRNSFYHNLGYKVVWIFDFIEEFHNGSIVIEKDGNSHWNKPKTTFNKRSMQDGQVDLYFQFNESNSNECLAKIVDNEDNRFEFFKIDKFISVQEFLSIFHCTNESCPKPYIESEMVNSDYLEFKHKYSVILDKQQERAVQTIEGANLILAIPGSGKTTVLITRIAYMVKCRHIDGRSILALTYTKNSAAEMKKRYTDKFGVDDSVEFCTINSFAYDISGKKEVIKKQLQFAIIRNIYKQKSSEFLSENEIRDALLSISYIKNMMLTNEEMCKLQILKRPGNEVYEEYQRLVKESGTIDYDDQLVEAYEALTNDKELLSKLQNRFKYFCLDEAQDTSKLQFEIIKLLASKSNNVFFVGDEDQSNGIKMFCNEEEILLDNYWENEGEAAVCEISLKAALECGSPSEVTFINLQTNAVLYRKVFVMVEAIDINFSNDFYVLAADFENAYVTVQVGENEVRQDINQGDAVFAIPYKLGEIIVRIPAVNYTWFDLDKVYSGDNIWKDDVEETSMLSISAASNIELYVEIGDYRYRTRNINLFNIVKDEGNSARYNFPIILIVNGQRYKIGQLIFTEMFTNPPVITSDNTHIYWDGGISYIGGRDNSLELQLLSEDEVKYRFELAFETSKLSLPDGFEDGEYTYQIVKSGDEEIILAQDIQFFGNPNKLRFLNKTIEISEITENVGEGSRPQTIKPVYVEQIHFIERTYVPSEDGIFDIYEGQMYFVRSDGSKKYYSRKYYDYKNATFYKVNPVRIIYINDIVKKFKAI